MSLECTFVSYHSPGNINGNDCGVPGVERDQQAKCTIDPSIFEIPRGYTRIGELGAKIQNITSVYFHYLSDVSMKNQWSSLAKANVPYQCTST